jgi:hypothetical protein
MSLSKFKLKVKGRVRILDISTNQIILDVHNAIHEQNMATAVARGLTGGANSYIHSVRFGNGGTVPTEGTQVTFKSPNVFQKNAALYNQTHVEVLNSTSPDFETGNFLTFQEDEDLFPIVICLATISADQPNGQLPPGQELIDNTSNQFAFDELGLFTADNKMLSHVIFPPRLKTAGKELIMSYTLTIITEDEVET